jgi:hypothetical protein
MQTQIDMQAKIDNWDLSEARSIKQRTQPNFKYNIYSETMGDFVLENDSDNASLSVLVRTCFCLSL